MSNGGESLVEHVEFKRRRSSPLAARVENGGRDEKVRSTITKFKKSHALNGLSFLWLCAIHILGIYLFAKGFLLTRLILEHKSTCESPPAEVSQIFGSFPTSQGCWYPRGFSRAVIIVVDALRYDFTVPFQPSVEGEKAKQFHNAFPVLYDTARTRPGNAFLLPFIADPPTTTLQRLKGLTTGTLPTLIDAGANFAGTAIEEDNVLMQMCDLGKRIVHLGDDTWQSLFPGYFQNNLSHPYDSFNVWDLHTVDDGVTSHLMPLLKSGNGTEWDFIFAHFLGVDHAGHRYGPDHPAMKDKLQQMNGVVTQIMGELDEGTILMVMGDHGMDTKGDHGGESDEEVEAALWMYSARPAFGRTHPSFVTPPENGKIRPVRQTDLVSTLSLLVGLPIPFNNIGAPIEEAFSQPNGPDWRALAMVNHIVAAQIRRYQEIYTEARHLGADPHQDILYESALSLLRSDAVDSKDDDDRFKEAYSALREYQNSVLNIYRRLWATFDYRDMVKGTILLMGGLAFEVGFSASKSELQATKLAKAVPLGMVLGFFVALLWDQLRPVQAVFGLGVGASLAAFSTFSAPFINPISLVPRNLWSWLALFFTASQAVGYSSNSFTIHEDTILLLFLTTFGVVSCASSVRRSEASDRYVGLVHSLLFTALTRVASFSRLCREEQFPGCRSTFYASSNSSTSAPWQILLPFIIAIILPAFFKARYRGTGSDVVHASFWLGFCLRVGLLMIAIYWTLDAADNSGWLEHAIAPETLKDAGLFVARCVIGVGITAGVFIVGFARPHVDLSPEERMFTEGQANDDSTMESESVPVILGGATVHGARYLLLLPIFVLVLSIVLPPMGQFSIAICTCQILCLLEMLGTSGLTMANTAIGPTILAMLGSFHFFKTGHQATLASIQWNAAFVPFRTITYPWSPLLVILNTFAPQILCASAVPLTVLWKRKRRPEGEGHGRGRDRDRDRDTDPKGWMDEMVADVMSAMRAHVLYYATIQLATTVWAAQHRRHLMLYRIFLPRFLMGSAVLVVVDLVLLFVAWGTFRSIML